ncbi:unnamed protein product [Bursaphelenchus xylophilus]|uniref:(pine wood nematode) hypothetical protein n=1 Tax=Bursaphelenchus xylophilus TaxID=6326 RepID=A0A1I7RV61_BURXY|nr:unnamed protein product [Bursaphelenchus xylophilus]CAG9124644.1 unnamed protein product [Bursaphelenchus xylophilus]
MVKELLLLVFVNLVLGKNDLGYNENTAKKLLVLSAGAYSKDPAVCLQSHFDVVEMVDEVTVDCGRIFDHDCFGYVALLHKKKALAIGFRGSTSAIQLLTQATSALGHKVPFLEDMGKINRYFHHAYKLLWERMEDKITDSIKKYPDYKVWISGHSLGGALASLVSATLVRNEIVKLEQTENYSFGQPRVGEIVFASRFKEVIPNYFRIAHAKDIVTYLFPRKFGYRHFPNEVWYPSDMTSNTTYSICKDFTDPECHDESNRDNVEDHRMYFGVHVGRYGKAGCPLLNLNTTDEVELSVAPTSIGKRIENSILAVIATFVSWLFME